MGFNVYVLMPSMLSLPSTIGNIQRQEDSVVFIYVHTMLIHVSFVETIRKSHVNFNIAQ